MGSDSGEGQQILSPFVAWALIIIVGIITIEEKPISSLGAAVNLPKAISA